MTKPRLAGLAKAVKIYLDVMWVLCWLGAAGVAVGLLMVLFAPEKEPRGEPPPISVLARFVVVPNEEAAVQAERLIPQGLTHGEGHLRVPSASRRVWALQLVVTEAFLLVVLFVTGDLRGLFRAVAGGQPFAAANARRVRRVGLVVVAWNVAAPFLKYFIGRLVVADLSVEGLLLKPPLDFRPEGLFLGLAIVVLGEILNQASRLEQDQSLTI